MLTDQSETPQSARCAIVMLIGSGFLPTTAGSVNSWIILADVN